METVTTNSTTQKKKNPIFIFLGICFLAIVITVIFSMIDEKKSEKAVIEHLESGDWCIVSDDEYLRDGKKCIGYRVYVKSDYASSSVYKDIFSYITSDDGYYLHTMWIYSLKSSANGSYSADYIMEQSRQGELPEPVRQ